MLDKIRHVPEVQDVAPLVEGAGADNAKMAQPPAWLCAAFCRKRSVTARPSHDILSGGSLNDFGGDKIAIGIRMADRLNVQVGDTITLISPVSKTTVFGAAPRLRGYTVSAIFDVGMFEYDNNFVFMPLPAAQIFFRTGEGVSALEIFVKNPQRLNNVRANVVAAIGGPGYRLLDWQQNNSSFVTALAVERNVMFLILTMIILVAAFNIISSLIMLVKDKGSDIAILRTMGATRGMIMRIFFLNGASIGIGGTLFGLLLGLFVASHIEQLREVVQFLTHTDPFSPEVYFLTRMPSVVEWDDVMHVVLMALGLSFLATLYPSWRAARLDPVEALRYE